MLHEPGIEYHAQLPLSWQDGPATPQQAADWMHENAIALHAITALEAPAHERDLDHSTGVDFTAARLEAKMDLLLQWVGKLLLAQHPLPATSTVVLASQSIAWNCPTALTAGHFGVITLYLAPHLPMPLMLPVQILDYSAGQARAQLLHLNEEAQDGLDRALFRYHRRALQARNARV